MENKHKAVLPNYDSDGYGTSKDYWDQMRNYALIILERQGLSKIDIDSFANKIEIS